MRRLAVADLGQRQRPWHPADCGESLCGLYQLAPRRSSAGIGLATASPVVEA
jgi:hypothetical protein